MQPLLWHISIEFFFYKIACDLKKKTRCFRAYKSQTYNLQID